MKSGYDFAMDYLDSETPHALTGSAANAARFALAKIGEDSEAQEWLLKRPPIVLVGHDDDAFTWRISAPIAIGSAVIVLGRGILRKPAMQPAAVLAHEVAHLWLRDHCPAESKGDQAEELAADRKASEWGFGDLLLASLEADEAREVDPAKKAKLLQRVHALRTRRAQPTSPLR